MIGGVTFFSFIIVGLIPLLLYLWSMLFGFDGNLFLWSGVLTVCAFMIIGFMKSYVTQTSKLKGVIETLGLGVLAAGIAYYVGVLLENFMK